MPTALWCRPCPTLLAAPPLTQLHAIPLGPVAVTQSRAQRCPPLPARSCSRNEASSQLLCSGLSKPRELSHSSYTLPSRPSSRHSVLNQRFCPMRTAPHRVLPSCPLPAGAAPGWAVLSPFPPAPCLNCKTKKRHVVIKVLGAACCSHRGKGSTDYFLVQTLSGIKVLCGSVNDHSLLPVYSQSFTGRRMRQ